MSIARDDITGLILCGGRGLRMGGTDKGLQVYQGMPLAMHALLRLAPQVGTVMINANRNLAAYESMGVPVWPDSMADFPGPLGGWLVGLERCETRYLAVVPCDSPHLPTDLVERLAKALEAEGAEIAMAATQEDGRLQLQPVFCLMEAQLLERLAAYLKTGERKIGLWSGQHRCAKVLFEDAAGFINVNTAGDLQALEEGSRA